MLSMTKLMPTSDAADVLELDTGKIQETLSNKPGTEAVLADVNTAFHRLECFFHQKGSWSGIDKNAVGHLRLGAEQWELSNKKIRGFVAAY